MEKTGMELMMEITSVTRGEAIMRELEALKRKVEVLEAQVRDLQANQHTNAYGAFIQK